MMSAEIQSDEILTAEQIAEITMPTLGEFITFDNLVVGDIYVDEYENFSFFRVKSKGAKFATLERLHTERETQEYLYNLPSGIAGLYQVVKVTVTSQTENTLKMVYKDKFGMGRTHSFLTTPTLTDRMRYGWSVVAYYGNHIHSKLSWSPDNQQVWFYEGGLKSPMNNCERFYSNLPTPFSGLFTRPFDIRQSPNFKAKWRVYMDEIQTKQTENPQYFSNLGEWYNNTLLSLEEQGREHAQLNSFYNRWSGTFIRAKGIPFWSNLDLEYKRRLVAEFQPQFQVWESQRQQLVHLMTFEHNEQMVVNIPSHATFKTGTNEQRAEFLAQLQAFHDETVRQQEEQVAIARERRRQEELERLGSYLTPEAPEARQERLQAQVAPEIVEEEPLAPEAEAVVVQAPEQPQAPEAEQQVEVAEVAPEQPPNGL